MTPTEPASLFNLPPKNTNLSFGKIRASWAQVGKDANPYSTVTYVNPPIAIGNFTGVGNQYVRGNPYLKPEIQTSWEIGVISGLSERAINKIISDAMTKLNAVTRAQAVVDAIRAGEIEM